MMTKNRSLRHSSPAGRKRKQYLDTYYYDTLNSLSDNFLDYKKTHFFSWRRHKNIDCMMHARARSLPCQENY